MVNGELVNSEWSIKIKIVRQKNWLGFFQTSLHSSGKYFFTKCSFYQHEF